MAAAQRLGWLAWLPEPQVSDWRAVVMPAAAGVGDRLEELREIIWPSAASADCSAW
jgi:hypothetical protein